MKALYTVWAKELTDLFRDRRTLMISLLMGPLLMPALILGIGKLASDRIIDRSWKNRWSCRWSAPATRRT